LDRVKKIHCQHFWATFINFIFLAKFLNWN